MDGVGLGVERNLMGRESLLSRGLERCKVFLIYAMLCENGYGTAMGTGTRHGKNSKKSRVRVQPGYDNISFFSI